MGRRGRIETPLAIFSGSDRYRWHVLGAVLVGAFMSAFDASIVNIALPAVTATYHSRLGVVEWVPLSYLLTLTLALPALGRLAAMFGRKPLYNLGFVVFIVGSCFCGAAPGIVAPVLWQVLQATGAALLQDMMRSLGMMCGVAFAQFIYSRELHELLDKAAAETEPITRQLRYHDMMLSFDKVYVAMIFVAVAAALMSVLKQRQELAGHKHLETPLEL